MLKTRLLTEIRNHRLPADFMSTIDQWYTPIATEIANQQQKKQGALLVTINGSQGSGKTTLTHFLALLLEHEFGLNVIDFSLDDFYLTKAERLQLAEEVHPLLATRGVPGTHDVELATACLNKLLQKQPCTLPQFDKSIDDRATSDQWKTVEQPVDIILFEGWCMNAPAQTQSELVKPVNSLEASEDADGAWRQYVNEALLVYNEKLFELSDYFVFLQIPDFDLVYEWRGLQEKKLALDKMDKASKAAVMDQQQVRRFIQHYERITRHCLKQLPTTADMIVALDKNHTIVSLKK